MTDKKKSALPYEKKPHPIFSLIIIFLLLSPTFLYPKEISEGVFHGIRLCAFNIIPSIFPFFIIADAAAALSGDVGESPLGKIFERFFHLPRAALSAFLLGNICGFPIGVKCSSELYKNGALTKKEAEHLIGFSNNPSFAFVTSAVGLGMFRSFKLGVGLYFSVFLSSVLIGFLFREKDINNEKRLVIPRQRFDFVNSVKNAGLSSVTVCSYIIFFCALSGLLIHTLGDGLIGTVLVILQEVSGASALISQSPYFGKKVALILTSMALGFSGFSVHLQARSIAAPEISFGKYYLMKAISPFICAIFCIIFLQIFKL